MTARFHRRLPLRDRKSAIKTGMYGTRCVDLDAVDRFSAQRSFESLIPLAGALGETFAHACRAGVDLDHFARLGVLHGEQTHLQEIPFARVVHVQGHQVVPASNHAQRAPQRRQHMGGIASALEIRENAHHGAPPGHGVDEIECVRDVCATTFRLTAQHLAHDAQHMLTTLARWNECLDLVGEQDQPDLVVIANGREREHAGDLRLDLALGVRGRAEVAGGAHVDREHDGQFALLPVLLDERAPGTRRHVPVDGAHLVAGHVFAYFFEIHAPAPEHRVELSSQGIGGKPARANIDETDLFQDLLDILFHGHTVTGWVVRRESC